MLHDGLSAAFSVPVHHGSAAGSHVIPDVTRELWEAKLSGIEMEKFLEFLDLTVDESLDCDLFGILDKDKSGVITAEDCIDGCVRLAGNARSMDLWLLHAQFQKEKQLQEAYRIKASSHTGMMWERAFSS